MTDIKCSLSGPYSYLDVENIEQKNIFISDCWGNFSNFSLYVKPKIEKKDSTKSVESIGKPKHNINLSEKSQVFIILDLTIDGVELETWIQNNSASQDLTTAKQNILEVETLVYNEYIKSAQKQKSQQLFFSSPKNIHNSDDVFSLYKLFKDEADSLIEQQEPSFELLIATEDKKLTEEQKPAEEQTTSYRSYLPWPLNSLF